MQSYFKILPTTTTKNKNKINSLNTRKGKKNTTEKIGIYFKKTKKQKTNFKNKTKKNKKIQKQMKNGSKNKKRKKSENDQTKTTTITMTMTMTFQKHHFWYYSKFESGK